MMQSQSDIILACPGSFYCSVELAKLLIKQDTRINSITILHWRDPLFPENHLLTKAVEGEPRIDLHRVPDIEDPPPAELFVKSPESYRLEFMKKMAPKVVNAVRCLQTVKYESENVGLVLDIFCLPLIDVAKEFNLSSYVFIPSNTGILATLEYVNKNPPDFQSGHQIPGFECYVPTKFLPPSLFVTESFVTESYDAWVQMGQKLHESNGVLVNSCHCLEPYGFDHFLHDNYDIPIYQIGPLLSSEYLLSSDLIDQDRDRIMNWLKDQPDCSVLYICFGSNLTSGAQIREIGEALLQTNRIRFIWSMGINPIPHHDLPESFIDQTANRGIISVSTAPNEVLAHKSIKAFVSQSDWGTVLQSIWFGVPMITWPFDEWQLLNTFKMVKELRLAVEVRFDHVGEVLKAHEIAKGIRALMETEVAVGIRVKAMAGALRTALTEGGSSFVATTNFIEELIPHDP